MVQGAAVPFAVNHRQADVTGDLVTNAIAQQAK
jgi:hypothetical protein